MSKHTPGPWKVVEDPVALSWDVGITDYDIGTDDFRGLIAWLSQTNLIPRDEQGANATLIADAPALLDALEALSPYLELDEECADDEWDDAVNRAHALLRKHGRI